MSTNTALDQIKARVEGHTEGPWEVASDTHEYRGGGFMQVDPKVGSRSICDVTDQHKPNAELIAAAPKLLAALEAVEAVLDARASQQRAWMNSAPEGSPARYDAASRLVEIQRTTSAIHEVIEEALR